MCLRQYIFRMNLISRYYLSNDLIFLMVLFRSYFRKSLTILSIRYFPGTSQYLPQPDSPKLRTVKSLRNHEDTQMAASISRAVLKPELHWNVAMTWWRIFFRTACVYFGRERVCLIGHPRSSGKYPRDSPGVI